MVKANDTDIYLFYSMEFFRNLKEVSPANRAFCQEAQFDILYQIKTCRHRILSSVMDGSRELYRHRLRAPL